MIVTNPNCSTIVLSLALAPLAQTRIVVLSEVTAMVVAEHVGTLDVVVGEPTDGSGLGAGAS